METKEIKKLDFKEKQKTSYCISNELRDTQVEMNMRKIKDRIQPEDPKTDAIAIVGYGPSLNSTWEELKDFKYIFTCSGAHRFLLDKGLKPSDFTRWMHNDLDPRPHKVKILGEPEQGVEYYAASTIHPNYLEKLKYHNVKLWHIFSNEDEAMRILPPGEFSFTGGSDVGMRTMVLARFLGFTDLHIFGMDGCYSENHGFHAAEHPNQPPHYMQTDLNGKTFYTTPALMECAKQFPREVDELTDCTAKFYGEGLVQEIMKDYKRNPKRRSSYIWFNKPELISDEYRKLNIELHESNMMYGLSGGKHADTVKKLLKTLVTEDIPFPSCLDYGCGKSALSKALGFPIFEYDPAIPGKEESPKPADLVICTDVLEHIEPDKLDFVLGDLRRCTKRMGYFVISTRQAVKKYSNGQNAHLIVKGKDWWAKQLSKYFSIPENAIQDNQELKELHIVLVPKIKEEKKPEQSITELHGIKFYTPNDLTKWRAESLLTKEPCTTEWIKAIPKDSVLFDVGACIGSYSLMAGINGVKAYAFEPEPENFSVLSKNFELNNLEHNTYCLAISNKKEVGSLYISKGGAGQSCHSFNSPSEYNTNQTKVGCLSMTLDELVEMGLPHPDYIKIDVDGFEPKVIKGAVNILEKGIKGLLIEINTKNPDHEEIVKFITSLGYEFNQEQVDKAKRKSGAFEGVAEYIFTKKEKVTVTEYKEYLKTIPKNYPVQAKVRNAAMELEPYNYLYVEDIIPDNRYWKIRDYLKEATYTEIEKSRGTKGYPLRYTAEPSEYMKELFLSEDFKKALVEKFSIEDKGDLVEDLLLVRDLPGYAIPPHTDSLRKVITVLIYLPQEETEEGTSIYVPKQEGYTCQKGHHHSFEDFNKVKTMPFKPNSAFIFARTDNSFHGVEPCSHVRDVLLYNINRK